MDLAENLQRINDRIAAACARAGRSPDSVTLVAVSKNHPAAAVDEALRLGVAVFGENRVQEAKAKIPSCSGRARWHFIGHLQSNKARDAARLFDMVESVDSLALAEELDRRAEQEAKTLPVLLQANIAAEATKFGYAPERLLAELEALNRLRHLEIHGLMTIAPWTPEPAKARPVFRRLRELREQCEQRLGTPLPHLSMGMSGDFEVAIEEGATLVRIGTALFGPRPALRAGERTDD
jgi:pyridoxal phosphate enzyme (YggS family)